MKPTLFSLAAAVAVLGLTGCGDNSPTTGAAPGGDSKSVGAALDKAASTAGDAAGKVMAQAKDALDKAQQMVGQGKFQEAQDLLKTIESLKLTPEQQKSLSD
ncbi:MAG: hypothetical protein HYR88_00540, partial [Verrucomicrobia bacterium]|nr:hypothetical protein [Verrucomicrobiota bacterium]